ncbi:U3 small nucleolar ribonucleoprotein MPP10, partial [Stegodyphus mimosarum]
METCVQDSMFQDILSSFEELTKNPEIYVEQHPETTAKFQSITKSLYDFTWKLNSFIHLKSESLPKLLVEGFDEEQIWQQIELQNKCAVTSFSKIISNINPQNAVLHITTENNSSQKGNHEDVECMLDDESSINDENEEYVFDDDDSDSSVELPQKTVENNKTKLKPLERSKHSSIVDDQFFKLSKMEQFLKIEDLKEEKGDAIASENEDKIDLFQDIPSDDIDDSAGESDEEPNSKTKKSSKDLMYEDFFDAPELGDENDEECSDAELSSRDGEKNGSMSEDILNEDSNDEMNDVNGNDENLGNMQLCDISKSHKDESTQKTAFELEQEKIKKKIEEYEKNMLEPLPWHLTGEVAASSRPIDSLVHQQTDFDSNAKQDLVVDSVLNEKIESVIKMAIMNKAFNDVERKIKPTEEIIAYKKEIVLDQTKSKKGLAEIYEEDYLKKQKKSGENEEEEDPKHKEIKKLMDSLLPELHALFSFIPKPAIPDIKVVRNVPAIAVEEVAPTNVSDATLLAPEEVKKKTGLIKGDTERDETDRKRERRKKKLLQKLKQKKKEKEINAKPLSAKAKKKEKIDSLKKLKQHRNTKIAKMDSTLKIKSSKDFFSRLQETNTLQMKKKK